jgi:hypothetical protein
LGRLLSLATMPTALADHWRLSDTASVAIRNPWQDRYYFEVYVRQDPRVRHRSHAYYSELAEVVVAAHMYVIHCIRAEPDFGDRATY